MELNYWSLYILEIECDFCKNANGSYFTVKKDTFSRVQHKTS